MLYLHNMQLYKKISIFSRELSQESR
jgi:hypothetical protein